MGWWSSCLRTVWGSGVHSGGDGVCFGERDRGGHEVVLEDFGTAGDNGGVLAVWGR